MPTVERSTLTPMPASTLGPEPLTGDSTTTSTSTRTVVLVSTSPRRLRASAESGVTGLGLIAATAAATNAVVASLFELSAATGVGAAGTPLNTGLSSGAR